MSEQTSQSPRNLASIVIVGGGTTGWLTAALLARVLPSACRITLVESSAIGVIGVGEATIPQLLTVNKLLGVSEGEMLRFTGGTYKLGLQLVDWYQPGESYYHAFGDTGLPLGFLPFYQYWIRARAAGRALPLGAYCLNAEAATQNRFMHPSAIVEQSLRGRSRYAYQFDASKYVEYLRGRVPDGRIARIEGIVGDVRLRPDDGFVESLVLTDGRSIAGDFFIGCTGFRAVVIGGALGVGYDDWRRWLPCDRAVATQSTHGERILPYVQAIARPAGWQWRIDLQQRTGNGYVYCSEYVSADAATAGLLGHIDGHAPSDAKQLRFASGMRNVTWKKNCLALGLAAGFLEPLESTTIHLVQSGVERFVSMLPDRDCDSTLVDAYNKATRLEYEHVRDFLVLHYWATNHPQHPFWTHCATMEVPDSLVERIRLFRHSGRIVRDANELFTDESWLQVMIGQHVIPERYNSIADGVDDDRLFRFLEDVRALVVREVARWPTHEEYLTRLKSSAGLQVQG